VLTNVPTFLKVGLALVLLSQSKDNEDIVFLKLFGEVTQDTRVSPRSHACCSAIQHKKAGHLWPPEAGFCTVWSHRLVCFSISPTPGGVSAYCASTLSVVRLVSSDGAISGRGGRRAQDLMKSWGVRQVPQFHFWRNKEKVDELVGSDPKKLAAKVAEVAGK
jgi:hypothetical protein